MIATLRALAREPDGTRVLLRLERGAAAAAARAAAGRNDGDGGASGALDDAPPPLGTPPAEADELLTLDELAARVPAFARLGLVDGPGLEPGASAAATARDNALFDAPPRLRDDSAAAEAAGAAVVGAARAAALRRRAYEVALPVVDGSVGLSIGVFDGVVVVRALNGGKDLAPSAAQACGAIAAGDRLLAVGGVELAPLPMAEARSRRAHSPRALRALSESENARALSALR